MNYELPSSDLAVLRRYQRNVSGKEYVKVTCILMLCKGCSVEFTSDCSGIDGSTVYRYWDFYTAEGLDSLLENKYKGYWGLLSSEQLSQLRTELKHHIYTDAKSVSAWIKDTFEATYTPQGVVDLLNRIGFTYKKTKEVPCECDIEKQQIFMEELSEIFESVDGKTVIINGLLNAKDVTDIIAVDCERVNTQSTKELYQKAIEKHPEVEKIYIISDNARYYRNKELTAWQQNTKIEQIFLPPYSPNLNLIERLWRVLRKKVININFYRKKELFRMAVHDFFEDIQQYKPELESLLTLNFRLRNSHSFSF